MQRLRLEKYPDAAVVFLAGSVVRGEGTSTSDLDIVVIYDSLVSAYRDSYYFSDWPVEAFVHDPQTLKYFFENVDAPTGVPSLPSMVSEGIEVPVATQKGSELKQMADALLQAGPPQWSPHEIASSRYHISDLAADLKGHRDVNELQATASLLYAALSNHYFRSKGHWSARGKSVPRRLRNIDPQLAQRFAAAFNSLFVQGNPDAVISLAEEILADDGGLLFEGYRLDAPTEWRKA